MATPKTFQEYAASRSREVVEITENGVGITVKGSAKSWRYQCTIAWNTRDGIVFRNLSSKAIPYASREKAIFAARAIAVDLFDIMAVADSEGGTKTGLPIDCDTLAIDPEEI